MPEDEKPAYETFNSLLRDQYRRQIAPVELEAIAFNSLLRDQPNPARPGERVTLTAFNSLLRDQGHRRAERKLRKSRRFQFSLARSADSLHIHASLNIVTFQFSLARSGLFTSIWIFREFRLSILSCEIRAYHVCPLPWPLSRLSILSCEISFSEFLQAPVIA